MATFEKNEFKFPDELDDKEPEFKVELPDDDVKIEIEDDTPPEDRNKTPMPKEVVQQVEDDELEEYSDKAKERLKQLKKVWHDERREKERRERALLVVVLGLGGIILFNIGRYIYDSWPR